MTNKVSIHAPVMGATKAYVSGARKVRFNPRTRDGCDIPAITHHRAFVVSIHAPVMGATAVNR